MGSISNTRIPGAGASHPFLDILIYTISKDFKLVVNIHIGITTSALFFFFLINIHRYGPRQEEISTATVTSVRISRRKL